MTMTECGSLVSNSFDQQQKCFLSYTGYEGRVHSTMQGHGWNNEGIEAFNNHLMFVMEDREKNGNKFDKQLKACLLYTSPSPRDLSTSRMPSSA